MSSVAMQAGKYLVMHFSCVILCCGSAVNQFTWAVAGGEGGGVVVKGYVLVSQCFELSAENMSL